MPAKNGDFLRQHTLLTTTVPVTLGSEPDLFLGVTLAGAVGTAARGVVINSRDGFITVCLLGQVPAKVADTSTITAGSPVSVNSSGLIIPTTAGLNSIGIALESVTSASGDFIEIFVNPQPFIPAT